MEVEQLEHGRGRQDALAVPALEEDDVVAHVVGEVVALPFLFVKFISTAVWSMWILHRKYRVTRQVSSLGWVDSDLACSFILLGSR